MNKITIPFGPVRGKNAEVLKDAAYKEFAAGLQALQNTLDFKMGARDWCYHLEEHGLLKSEFDKAEDRIGIARKLGYLPLDFVLDDESRAASGDQGTDSDSDIDGHLDLIWNSVEYEVNSYSPVRWVDYQLHYVELLVEKKGLASLLMKTAQKFMVSVSNGRGDTAILSVAHMHRRFQEAEARGQKPVLLYCGDFDPKGMYISDTLKNRFSEGVGRYFEDGYILKEIDLELVRFGLNSDTIETLGLSKIDNLITGSGKDLNNPSHTDHFKPYVQDYLRSYGAWKCEANAIVVRPKEGRELFHEALVPYIDFTGIERYYADTKIAQQEIRKVLPDFLKVKLSEVMA